MSTLKAYATESNWCVYCPDGIRPGDAEITDPGLKDPFGDLGHAHADCAEGKGWTADEDRVGSNNNDLRAAVRQHVRTHGPIEFEMP